MTAPADLPTGTLTFLFTDIEGSTRLLRQLGDGYRAIQDRHAGILRDAITAEDGVVVRTEGDAVFAVFQTPAQAVRSAVSAQRGLAETDWPHGTPLRVRMGLHTGEGILGSEDYVGLDVNRAARIAAAGHGGQILLSEATRVLLGDGLPPGARIRGLGRHRLKDFDEPQPLHDLVVDDLPADFPPIRTAGGGPTNLPPERTSFVGRERELDEIEDLLRRSRLVTLTGPGGTGKTRLALGVAGNEVERFPDGVFLVDLSAVTDPAVVPSTIATALAMRENPSEDIVRTLGEHLRERQLLLVLDNLEQVIEAAGMVDRLLNTAPGLRVLATSRVPLHLAGEHEYHVSPLPLPRPDQVADLETLSRCESVMLLVERATAVRPGFRVTEETAGVVAEIAARLDGLPLAIELAAGRLKLLSPAELLERLGRRLPLLTGGARNVPERQRTLRAAIEWSHDLLGPEERRLFARLSVFAGGWTLAAAEAVCGSGLDSDVLDGTGELVDHNLVRRGRGGSEETRFRMLQTIREFAGERLEESEEADEIRRRHAWHVVALSESAEPELVSTGPARLDQLEEEHDNVRAALRWSIDSGEVEPGLRIVGALWRFWHVRGHLAEGRGWTEELMSLPASGARTAARAKALGAQGSLAYYGRDPDHVRGAYEESLAISRELGDRAGEAEGAYNLAFAYLLEQDLAGAKDLLLQAGEIYRALDDPVRVAHVNTVMAQIRADEGDLDQAEPLIEEARSTFEAAGDLWGIVFTSGQLAALALRRGDLEAARTATLQSLETSLAMGVRGWNAVAVQGLAVIAIRQRNPELGIRLAGAADRLRELAGSEAPRSIVGLEDPLQIVKGLPQHRIDALWEEGRAMSVEEALEQARRGA